MRSLSIAVTIAAVAIGAVAVAACNKKSETEGGDDSSPSHTADSRGVVKNVAIGPDRTSLSIHHEAIADWVNRQGNKMPMMSMTMEFAAAPGLDVGGVASGDKIAFGIAVYYGTDNPRIEVTSIKKLPADTTLELSGH